MTVWIGGNTTGREITQEVIKAIPRGKDERLDQIRNNGDEEEDMNSSDIKWKEMVGLSNWWIKEESSLASWCLAWASRWMAVSFTEMWNTGGKADYGGLGIKMVSSVWDTLNIWDVCEWLDLWFWPGIADLAYSIPYLVVEVMGMDKLPERERKGNLFSD